MQLKTANIHEAKTQLLRPIEEAAASTKIVIAKVGRPRAPGAVRGRGEAPVPGALKGRIRVRADFDALLPPEIGRSFGVSWTRIIPRSRRSKIGLLGSKLTDGRLNSSAVAVLIPRLESERSGEGPCSARRASGARL